MTRLSVNLNKIALLRNSRGRDYPNVVEYARKCISLGVDGITIHPRPDERHAKKRDACDLGLLCEQYAQVEFNIEGYPAPDFLALCEAVKPDQCTLVPDDAAQLTSDHGWDIDRSMAILAPALQRLADAGIRSSLFVDPDPARIVAAASAGADRVELYTEAWANAFGQPDEPSVFAQYREAALRASELGIGINAGHDLDLDNLARFLEIPGILEVSIGHALTVECLFQGIEKVIPRYLEICAGSA